MDSSQENDQPSWESGAGSHFDMLSPYRPNSANFPTPPQATLQAFTTPQATLQAFTTAQLSDGQFQQLTTMAGQFQPTFQAAVSSNYERVSPVEDFATEVTPSSGSLPQSHGLHLVDGRSATRPLITVCGLFKFVIYTYKFTNRYLLHGLKIWTINIWR